MSCDIIWIFFLTVQAVDCFEDTNTVIELSELAQLLAPLQLYENVLNFLPPNRYEDLSMLCALYSIFDHPILISLSPLPDLHGDNEFFLPAPDTHLCFSYDSSESSFS